MAIEDPLGLLGRLRLGREEYCQRLLTMLILGDAYPRWNTRSRPSAAGAAFMSDLYAMAFGRSAPAPMGIFVDEFDLPARSDEEKGGAPDWAVLWPDRLWMIELKTERASHRDDQLPHYLELARHHHRGLAIDLTYLTPRMPGFDVRLEDGESYAHLSWDAVSPAIDARWGSGAPGERAAASMAIDVLRTLQPGWSEWRQERLSPTLSAAPVEQADPHSWVGQALSLAAATALDGKQRALDWAMPGVDALHEARAEVRNQLCSSPTEDSLRRVRPWVWRAAGSGGSAMTAAGVETGYELRFSRYDKPLC